MIEKIVNIKVDTNSATKSVDNLAKATNNLDASFDEVYKDLKPLTARMGEAEDRLYELANAGQTATAEYQGLLQKVGEYRKVQIQTDLAVDAASTTLASKLGGALNTVAGGFSLAQGAAGLMGSESQNLEKAILKVQSAMAISQGIETINESRKSVVALGNSLKATALYQKALAGATAVQTFVMNGATLAAKALRGALIATGVGALVVGVGLLIANFDKVKKVVMNLVPQLAIVGDVVMSIVNAVTDFVGVTSEAERANDRLMASAKNSLALNKKYLAEHGSQLDEFTKQKLAAKDKYNEAIQEENADRVALAKELNRELANIDKARQDEKDKANQAEQDKKNEANKKAKEAAQKLKDEAKAERERLKKEAQDISDNAKKANEDVSKTDLERLTDKYNSDLKLLKAQKLSTLEVETKYLNDVNDLNLKNQEVVYQINEKNAQATKEANDKRIADNIASEEAAAEAKKNINNIAIQSAQGVVSILSGLGEKNKAIQKTALIANGALSIAEIINNTNVGSSKEVATKGVFGLSTSAVLYAKMAVSIGSVIAATAKGLKGLGASGGVEGGGSQGGGGSAPAPPQFNIVGQSGTNQLAQTIAGQQNKPIEAYVVSSSVSTSQALDRNRVKTATFGG